MGERQNQLTKFLVTAPHPGQAATESSALRTAIAVSSVVIAALCPVLLLFRVPVVMLVVPVLPVLWIVWWRGWGFLLGVPFISVSIVTGAVGGIGPGRVECGLP